MRQLGHEGPRVFPLALGCAAMSPGYGGASDEAESLATIHAAIDTAQGRALIDTADFYGQGHDELLTGRASTRAAGGGGRRARGHAWAR